MYPLKFKPILKSTLWGGERIIPFKQLDCQQEQVGESWEISDVAGDESVVAEGADAGKNLTQLMEEYKGSWWEKKTTSDSRASSLCLSSLLTPSRICLFRYTLTMNWP